MKIVGASPYFFMSLKQRVWEVLLTGIIKWVFVNAKNVEEDGGKNGDMKKRRVNKMIKCKHCGNVDLFYYDAEQDVILRRHIYTIEGHLDLNFSKVDVIEKLGDEIWCDNTIYCSKCNRPTNKTVDEIEKENLNNE